MERDWSLGHDRWPSRRWTGGHHSAHPPSAAQEQVVTLDAIIDTGFTGFLTLPLQQIARLGFAYEGIIDARLGDGRAVEFDMFAGTVLWDGHLREGIVLAAEGSPLIGMALLSGSRITLDVADGGLVAIEPLP